MDTAGPIERLVIQCSAVTTRAASLGRDLSGLTLKKQKDEEIIQQIIVHVSAIRIASRALSELLDCATLNIKQIEDIKNDVHQVLIACSNIFETLEAYAANFSVQSNRTSLGRRKVVHWNKKIIRQCERALCKQETALILILSSLDK